MDQTLEDIAQVVAQAQQEEPQAEVSPVVPPYADNIVRLPVGLVEPAGSVVTTAEVRELTGFDEEAMSRVPSIGASIQQVLERAVVSVGTSDDVKAALRWLSIGDRLELLLGIRKVTWGPEIDTVTFCRTCNTSVAVKVDADSGIPRRPMEKRENVLHLPTGAEAVLTWPTGSLHSKILMEDMSPAETTTATIVDCVASLNGLPLLQGSDTARSMSMRDRKAIMTFIVENIPGPVLEDAEAVCETCGETVSVVIPVGALFPN